MSTGTDSESRAFASLRRANPVDAERLRNEMGEEGLAAARERVLAELGDAPARGARRAGRRMLPRSRPGTALLLLGALLLVAAAAAAATGLLLVGSVFRGEGFHKGGRQVEERVVATGTAAVSGRWRMTVFRTDRGLPCLKLTLLDERDRPGPRDSGYCGGATGFEAFSLGRKADARRRGETLLFGRAPGAARTVRLSADGGVRIRARTQRGPANVRGAFWLVAAPPGLRNARLTWIDADGRAHQPWLDVSFRFQGPTARTVVATGTAPVAGPWELTLHESGRLANAREGDVYEPEGLPCVFLRLLDPPANTAPDGGGCGDLRKSPGFFKVQRTVPGVEGARIRELLLFGRAPEEADAVEVRVRGEVRASVNTREGPASVPGDVWVLAASPGRVESGRVYWVDRDSGKRGHAVDVFPP